MSTIIPDDGPDVPENTGASDLVETVAKVMWHDRWDGFGHCWEEELNSIRSSYMRHARAALAAIEASGTHAVVPVEPTRDMLAEFEGYDSADLADMRCAYYEMLAARPRTGETP